MDSKINLVFAVDNQYVQHMAATLTSIFYNSKKSEDLIINVIDGGITLKNRAYLEDLVIRNNSQIFFKEIETNLLKNLVINGHITEATYYRILIPELFPLINKAVYLDCDIIVRTDIVNLWGHDIKNYALGAVRLYEYNAHEHLGIPKDANYFNAGILIMNLDKWRKENISQKVIEFIQKYPERLISWDQDALNGILYNDWFDINLKWNLRSQLYDMDFQRAGLQTELAFEELKSNPFIVHFTTASKPWHLFNSHPFKGEYFYYLEKSRYPFVKYPEKLILSSKDIVLFGTGSKSVAITNYLNEYSIKVAAYADNNSEHWDKTFLGKKVKNPQSLIEEKDNQFIIIASQYYQEIGEQLIGMGFVKEEHFVADIEEVRYLGYK